MEIEDYFSLAKSIAKNVSRKRPFLRDDLESESYLALLIILKKLPEGLEGNDLKKYLAKKIFWWLVNFSQHDSTVRIPKSSIQKGIANYPSQVYDHSFLGKSNDLVDLLDMVESCCTNDTEKRIIYLFSKGLNLKDVSFETGLTEVKIRRIRESVELKFNEKERKLIQ